MLVRELIPPLGIRLRAQRVFPTVVRRAEHGFKPCQRIGVRVCLHKGPSVSDEACQTLRVGSNLNAPRHMRF